MDAEAAAVVAAGGIQTACKGQSVQLPSEYVVSGFGSNCRNGYLGGSCVKHLRSSKIEIL